MMVLIGRKVILHVNLTTELPQFLRVDSVSLLYRCCYKLPIAKKCQTVVNNLQPFKKALIDSNVVTFIGQISQIHNSFTDHLQLLTHVREELMPIFASSRCYNFNIYLLDKDYTSASTVIAGSNVISSIIQMDSIDCCSNIEIKILDRTLIMGPMQLPIDPISNWLTRKRDVISKNSKERFLRISINNFENALQLCDHLIKVFKIFKVIFCSH